MGIKHAGNVLSCPWVYSGMAQQELSLEILVDSETDMKTLGMWEARSTTAVGKI